MQDPQQTYQEIESTLGHVPAFMKEIPPETVGPFWEKMRDFEMADTAIPVKYKDLIGLAVAAAIPCSYCTVFHKESAILNGATEREMREAIAMAASVREGSTLVNGFGQDLEAFREDVREIVRHVRAQRQGGQATRQAPR